MIEEQKEERDYTEERNVRVLPAVSFILRRLGRFLKGRTEGMELGDMYIDFYRTLFVPKVIKQDMQCNDINYTFSLTKTAIEMLEARSKTSPDADNPRVTSAGLEIMELLGEQGDLQLVQKESVSEEKDEEDGIARAKLYDGLYQSIVLPTLSKYGIGYNEVEAVFAEMKLNIDNMALLTTGAFDEARKRADTVKWGVEDIDNLTIKQLNDSGA